jgi:hypothetical protein
MGDKYLKAEFRRHQTASSEFVPSFLIEWTKYRDLLQMQLSLETPGMKLATTQLDSLTDEQIRQLYELKKASLGKPE